MLHKLKESNILGKVGVWLARFLDSNSRQQALVVDGRLSAMSSVVKGVSIFVDSTTILISFYNLQSAKEIQIYNIQTKLGQNLQF